MSSPMNCKVMDITKHSTKYNTFSHSTLKVSSFYTDAPRSSSWMQLQTSFCSGLSWSMGLHGLGADDILRVDCWWIWIGLLPCFVQSRWLYLLSPAVVKCANSCARERILMKNVLSDVLYARGSLTEAPRPTPTLELTPSGSAAINLRHSH